MRFTAEDFALMGDAGLFGDRKVELVDGEIEEVTQPGFRHARLQGKVLVLLANAYRETRCLVLGTIGVTISDLTVRGPDVLVIQPGVERERWLEPGDVLLAVEISDTTLSRDLIGKAADYGAAGIAHYWVVDVEAQAVHVFGRPDGGAYSERAIVRFGETLAAPSLDEGFIID